MRSLDSKSSNIHRINMIHLNLPSPNVSHVDSGGIMISRGLSPKYSHASLKERAVLLINSKNRERNYLISPSDCSFNAIEDQGEIMIHGRKVSKNAKEAILDGCELKEIPTQLSELELSCLNLSMNKIQILPQSGFSTMLSSLTSLDLSNNLIKTFPTGFQHSLTSLSTLNLANNRLSTFPVHRDYLMNLSSLNITGNVILSIPSYIASRPTFEKLIVEWKTFKYRPDQLMHFTNIEQVQDNRDLYFTRNEICHLMKGGNDLRMIDVVGDSFNSFTSSDYFMMMQISLKLRMYSLFTFLLQVKGEDLENSSSIQKQNIFKHIIEYGNLDLIDLVGFGHIEILLRHQNTTIVNEIVMEYVSGR